MNVKTINGMVTALAVAAALIVSGCSSNKTEVPASKPGQLEYWITTPDEGALLQKQQAVEFVALSGAEPSIVLDSTKQFQTMDGFGFALTGGSAQVINGMSAGARSGLLKELFGNEGNGISISYLRLSIGASDLNESVYSYNDLPPGQTDPNLEHFSLDPDRAQVIPVLKEILAINPGIRIMGSPWSPPVWMKDNGSSIGGSLKPEFYGAYANYFVKYIQGMKDEGITIDAITPQNEPLHPGNNPSMLMLAPQQAEFIRDHLGPAFRNAGINTKIVVYDHNCNKPEYAITVLDDAEARQYIDGSAFHLYEGDISALSTVHSAYPDKNLYFTEQYTGSGSSFRDDLTWHIRNLIIGAPRNWSRIVLEWNLANDPEFKPHTPGGCTTCKGGVTIDGSNVHRNVGYYIIAHASRFVPPGSVRIASTMPATLPNVAYRTPSGKTVVIVMNDNASQTPVTIGMGDRQATIELPPGAAATCLF